VGDVIGGIVPGAANLIAFSARAGVYVQGGTNHSLRGNSIHSNTGLGIDIDPLSLVANNDTGDGDAGPNDQQNYPVLLTATNEFGRAWITGTLNSRPSRGYGIDFFSNPVCDPNGAGEGKTYLGSVSVSTGANGNGGFATWVALKNVDERWITSTATDSFGNTSEFSRCLELSAAGARLRVIGTNGNFALQWPSYVPADYVVETTTNLSLNVWESAEGAIVDDGNLKSYAITPKPGEVSRFFRLRK
jgi:hypothetical protein